MSRYIDEHRGRFGVEPICRVLDVSASAYYQRATGKRAGQRPGWDGGLYAFMRRVLATEHGGGLYRKRQAMIEPVFGHTKFNRKIDRSQRRGRAAARSEWRLVTATHNLMKLYKHTPPRPRRPERPLRRPAAGTLHSQTDVPRRRRTPRPFPQQPPCEATLGSG